MAAIVCISTKRYRKKQLSFPPVEAVPPVVQVAAILDCDSVLFHFDNIALAMNVESAAGVLLAGPNRYISMAVEIRPIEYVVLLVSNLICSLRFESNVVCHELGARSVEIIVEVLVCVCGVVQNPMRTEGLRN